MVANENFNLTPNDESEDFTLEFGEVVNVGGGGGTSDFNQLTNRPKYNDQAMTGSTNIPAVPTKTSDLDNDSDYQTGSEVESAISSAIADKQDALTAGDNITIEDNTISATDTTYTAGANVSISDENVISATDTTYSNFTGTDGNTGGTSGLVPAPATTDAGKFLKADGTWDSAGGGGDTVYSTKTTSNSSVGGAVYIGNLDSSQVEQADPTTTDNHYKYFWALPFTDASIPTERSVNILGGYSNDEGVVIGNGATNAIGYYATAVGSYATVRADKSVAIGNSAYVDNNITNAVALGTRAVPTRAGEVNIGNSLSQGYNSTKYRVLGGVHDGQLANDAVTVGQVNATIDAINTALSTNIPHIGA